MDKRSCSAVRVVIVGREEAAAWPPRGAAWAATSVVAAATVLSADRNYESVEVAGVVADMLLASAGSGRQSSSCPVGWVVLCFCPDGPKAHGCARSILFLAYASLRESSLGH